MKGTQLAQKLLKIKSGVPVILCTGFSDTVNYERARKIGISEFIIKPASETYISEVMQKCLNKK